MRIKALSAVLVCFFALIFDLVPVGDAGAAHTVGEVEALAGGIVDYELEKAGADSVQSWIDGALTEGAGTSSEWFIVGLSQSGERNFSSYEKALKSYLSSGKVINLTSQEKYALALMAAGSTDGYITEALAKLDDKQGIMSWIYALHIINNGYTVPGINAGTVTEKLLSLQLADGGWALWGAQGDVDVTAMTLQALAPHYTSDSSVKAAVDRALALLSERQQPDGGYKGFGNDNPESAAQVLTALSALGIDCQTDPRFIKNGDIISAIASYRLADGSYCHVRDGETNTTATIQAYYSYVAYLRMKRGQSPLLVLDNRRAPRQEETTVTTVTTAVTTSARLTETAPVSTEEGTVTSAASGTVTTSAAKSSSSAVTTVTTVTVSTTVTSSDETPSETEKTSAQVSTSAAAAGKTSDKSGKGGYKGKAIAVICGAAGVLALAAFVSGKRNYKNFIAIGVAAAAGIVFVLATDFQSTESYYTGEKKHKENAVGTVTMTIRCDTVADRCDHDYIPEDGVILDVTEFDIEEGETVYDILIEAARAYRIQVENRGSSGSAHGMVYIAGINYLYEMDFGDLSGWVYHVNGIAPSRGCGEYKLSDGDRIEWLYTCELGHDLDEVYEE